MPPEMQGVADALRKAGFQEGGNVLQSLIALGAIPRDFPYPGELSLKDEWQRQSNRFLDLGFHRALGMSEQEYLDSLPHFTDKPEGVDGRFNYQLLVDPRVPIERLIRLLGVVMSSDESPTNVSDWNNNGNGHSTPSTAYVIRMNDGRENIGKSVREVREKLKDGERGTTLQEGLALYATYPWVVDKIGMNFVGSEKLSTVPYLRSDGSGIVRLSFEQHIDGYHAKSPTTAIERAAA